ncbi:lipocalin-like domain-containing protein [Lentzea sp. NPDC051213]|uniref:lipocalin-like domain-containing protein n=1 Tax=Lentzea sp. NPDC051213 TaxID=3364126 RepID=UPI00379849DD
MTTSFRERLVGSWQMIDWKVFRGGETIDPPLGPVEHCTGLLIYTEEGTMSANLMLVERAFFDDGSLDGGTQEERAEAYRSIISYAGTYAVNESTATVVHHVQIATFPNFVGTDLRRTCVFEGGDTLKLDTPPMKIGGELLASHIRWQRKGTEVR